MLIEFAFSNFRSFRDMTVLSMTAAKLKSKYANLDADNVFGAGKSLKLLKSKAIYGANASGKSNIMKAVAVFKRMVRESSTSHGDKYLKDAADDFILEGTPGIKPVFFQIQFIVDKVPYRYGFEVQESVGVVSEWLFAKPNVQEIKYFTREGTEVAVNAARMPEAKQFEKHFKNEVSELFKPWSLFLSAAAIIGVPTAKSVRDAIQEIDLVSDTYHDPMFHYMFGWWGQPENRKAGLEFLQAVDVNIDEFGVVENDEPSGMILDERDPGLKLPENGSEKKPHLTSVRFIHKDGEKLAIAAFVDSFESEGTKKLLYFVPLILDTLKGGTTLVIDELDARLHPRLTQKIVDIFHGPETNPNNAQLIFITHDTGLLKPYRIRRDQIAFVKKDKQGCSSIDTLIEYQGVRSDASYDKDYLLGAYGAVPMVSEVENAVAKNLMTHE